MKRKRIEHRVLAQKFQSEREITGIEGEQRCLNAQIEKIEKINTNPKSKN